MARISFAGHADLLVRPEHGADAAVYKLSDELAIVQSADFFPPMLPDAELFGRIAAANALSDIYALGARPVTALNLLCLPAGQDYDDVATVLKAAQEVVLEAGAVVAGGHTITGPQLQFGLSVTGVAHPQRVVRNTTAQAGDVLVLTKPLGTGLVIQAFNSGPQDRDLRAALAPAIASMMALNRHAAELMVELGAHAATDITGFGLLAHALDMLSTSELCIELDWQAVPLLPGTLEAARAGHICGGSKRNTQYMESRSQGGHPVVEFNVADAELAGHVLHDAQTSGGLLIALPEAAARELLAGLAERGYGLPAAIVGRITTAHPRCIVVV
jgi:selenide,water dikinase